MTGTLIITITLLNFEITIIIFIITVITSAKEVSFSPLSVCFLFCLLLVGLPKNV